MTRGPVDVGASSTSSARNVELRVAGREHDVGVATRRRSPRAIAIAASAAAAVGAAIGDVVEHADRRARSTRQSRSRELREPRVVAASISSVICSSVVEVDAARRADRASIASTTLSRLPVDRGLDRRFLRRPRRGAATRRAPAAAAPVAAAQPVAVGDAHRLDDDDRSAGRDTGRCSGRLSGKCTRLVAQERVDHAARPSRPTASSGTSGAALQLLRTRPCTCPAIASRSAIEVSSTPQRLPHSDSSVRNPGKNSTR